MDGTLLTENQQISEANLLAIQELKARKGLFTLATGRTEASVRPYVKQLELNLPLILCNGAQIYDPVSEQIIWESTFTLTQGVQDELNAVCKQHDLGCIVYQQGNVLTSVMNHKIKEHVRKDGTSCSVVEDLDPYLQAPITKVLLIGENILLQALSARLKSLDPDMKIVFSEHSYLELLPPGTSKGDAMEKLLAYLAIDETYTIAIGDNLNDLEMIEMANWGVAVSNAHPALHQAANYIASHHQQGAVAEVIKTFALPRLIG